MPVFDSYTPQGFRDEMFGPDGQPHPHCRRLHQRLCALAPGLRRAVPPGRPHAWVECLLPDGRWYGFDPTKNIAATDAYIKIHHGRDYDGAAPLRGLYHGAGDQRLDVAVRVFATQ